MRRWRPALFGCLVSVLLAGASEARDQATEMLSSAIAASSPGTANGYAFDRLVDLDPSVRYLGGAAILEDVCIRGHSATIDLAGEYIQVLAGSEATRFDIEYCLILNGSHPGGETFGGALLYGEGTQGWALNNTFYNNSPCGLYLDEVLQGDGVKVANNLFYYNAPWGLVRNDEQPSLYIRYNDAFANGGGNFGEHCACPSAPPEPIYPGTEELHFSNFSADPEIVALPNPPKVVGDFHLRETSPCIGAGEGGLDVGAFPFESPPAALETSWSRLKSLYR